MHHSARLIVHDITTTREATTHRASSAEVISSEAATSRVVAAATSRAVAEDMASSVADSASTLLAMTPMQNIA